MFPLIHRPIKSKVYDDDLCTMQDTMFLDNKE